MTVNIRKSCMCTAVEETDIEAILTGEYYSPLPFVSSAAVHINDFRIFIVE